MCEASFSDAHSACVVVSPEAIYIPERNDLLPREVIKDESLSRYIENCGRDRFNIALVVEVDSQLLGSNCKRLLIKENKDSGKQQ